MTTPSLISTVELARLAFPDLPKYPARAGVELASKLGIATVELRGRFYVNRAAAVTALATFPEKSHERACPPDNRRDRQRSRDTGALLRHIASGGGRC